MFWHSCIFLTVSCCPLETEQVFKNDRLFLLTLFNWKISKYLSTYLLLHANEPVYLRNNHRCTTPASLLFLLELLQYQSFAIKAEILTLSHQNTDGQCKCCKMLISCCHQVALCLSVSIGTKAPGLSSQVWSNFFCCSETSKFTVSSRRRPLTKTQMLHNLASRRSSD